MTLALSTRLTKIGWSAEVFDTCWLDCDDPGFRRHLGGWEIVLCGRHASELEDSASMGYSTADPPAHSRARWWPWRLVDAEDGTVASGIHDPDRDR